MTMNNTIFKNNVVQKTLSCLNIFGASETYQIQLNNVSFIGNKASQTTMLIMFGNVTLRNVVFQDNVVSKGTSGIFIGLGELYIYKSTFENTKRTTSFSKISSIA